MKTVLVINDNAARALEISKFAFLIAQKMQANVLLANLFEIHSVVNEPVPAGYNDEHVAELTKEDLGEYLDNLNSRPNDFQPSITEVDTYLMDENQLIETINKQNIWMVFKGMHNLPVDTGNGNLNIHHVLNKTRCPVMLIPETWEQKNIERLIYITDLRYCRLPIVRYLAEFAKPCHADLSIAHLSTEGIPDMDETYANGLFEDEVCTNVKFDQLLFNNIHEKNLNKAVDVIIHGMSNDVLVMVNNCYHLEEIAGYYLNDTLPGNITVPLLVFPY